MHSTSPRALRGAASILPAATLVLTVVLAAACGGGALAVAPDATTPGLAGSSSPAARNATPLGSGSCDADSVDGSASGDGTAALPSCDVPGAAGSPGAAPSTAPAAVPASSVSPASSASPDASPTAPPSPAPTSPVHFPYRRAVVPMVFPLPETASYAYGRDFLISRVGKVYPYNHARSVASNGALRRAHDGTDIAVAVGTVVRAPFSGTVVNPATRWKPWDPARYGKVVVIRSDEPTSPGYSVILAHLSKVSVKVGQHVSRGQVVGHTGRTGNAAGTPPHLHFELRAPFLIRVKEAGTVRKIDAFDPYPSLVAADPKRH